MDLAAASKDLTYHRDQIETEADRTNDRHSLLRMTERKLHLVIKTAQHDAWHLPVITLEAEHGSLRGACEALLQNTVDESTRTYTIGNCPSSVLPPLATAPNQTSFVMRALLVSDQASFTNAVKDFAWVTADELPEVLDADVANQVQKITF
ncbi:uncharacterized protein MONBRDRAFT_22358 [Monosiga brevicollis MX1]|uniref:Ribosomal protein L46 N-terminal domain-containing protein n=1 Tax=Monosiga brevicollis TaxID=81824 RepID=A9UQC6_MONBE|nr:uncharacterized protein MONBRDRAFT_22358 [Monosiga brevicollis MX1]EDQ93022.1 predicted protein [Monosiga brevicollis MX1]|eukprot:XP_001742784.1 hypothetical protein [Monosiga brevicollis MX1]